MSDPPASPQAISISPDVGRLYLKFPIVLSAIVAATALTIAVIFYAQPGHPAATIASAAMRIAVLSFVPFAYIRWFYPSRTNLVVNDVGITMRQPLATWTINWTDLSSVRATSPLEPTHRGGIAAGIRLLTTRGKPHHIPDIFKMRRNDIVNLIRQFQHARRQDA